MRSACNKQWVFWTHLNKNLEVARVEHDSLTGPPARITISSASLASVLGACLNRAIRKQMPLCVTLAILHYPRMSTASTAPKCPLCHNNPFVNQQGSRCTLIKQHANLLSCLLCSWFCEWRWLKIRHRSKNEDKDRKKWYGQVHFVVRLLPSVPTNCIPAMHQLSRLQTLLMIEYVWVLCSGCACKTPTCCTVDMFWCLVHSCHAILNALRRLVPLHDIHTLAFLFQSSFKQAWLCGRTSACHTDRLASIHTWTGDFY